mgnify:FL=1
MTLVTDIPARLSDALAPWFNDMSGDEFARVCEAYPDDLLVEAYLHLARQGVDASEVDPEELKETIVWFIRAKVDTRNREMLAGRTL